MNQEYLLLVPVLFPVLMGLCLLFIPVFRKKNIRSVFVCAVLALTLLSVGFLLAAPAKSLVLWKFTEKLPLYFKTDMLARLFAGLTSSMWLLVGIYAMRYMQHEEREERFYAFYLIVLGVLIGLDFSGNLITMYVFYELMTLTSLPLVLHTMTKEAVMAGLKYLFYSIAGAFLALLGIFFLYHYTVTMTFTPGGTLDLAKLAGKEGLVLTVVFFMLIGFGAKAGMFPLHGWLPTAHPIAPAPASAVLSGVITKSGVLAVIRIVFYQTGPDFLRGTWVQYAWLALTLLTVFMGSMLAYLEPVLKKRLAYSTVSQVSYILFGLATLTGTGFAGALLHLVFHSVIKNGLFLCAGAVIFMTKITRVDGLRGIGKKMPVTVWCFTLLSLALIGIPPASGFISKWYLAGGALEAEIGVFSWLGPVVLLISALLTAGYLLPVTVQGFFPGSGYAEEIQAGVLKKKEAPASMLVPIIFLAALSVLFGIFPNPLLSLLTKAAELLL